MSTDANLRPRTAPTNSQSTETFGKLRQNSLPSLKKFGRHASMLPSLKLPSFFQRMDTSTAASIVDDEPSIQTQTTVSGGSSIRFSIHSTKQRDNKTTKSPHTGHGKPPLVTLRLTSTSFLDADVIDIQDPQNPVYSIRTTGTSTVVKRFKPTAAAGVNLPRAVDDASSETQSNINTGDDTTKAACIKWPRLLPTGPGPRQDGVLVQMDGGRWKGGESFLRVTNISLSRKFNIPNYAPPLKWRVVGSGYQCVTESVKGPIASFEPANKTGSFPNIIIYETMHDKNNVRRLLTHGGVSIFLIDYLVVTALLMVTELQEWMAVPGNVKKGKRFGHNAVDSVLEMPIPVGWSIHSSQSPYPTHHRPIHPSTPEDQSQTPSGELDHPYQLSQPDMNEVPSADTTQQSDLWFSDTEDDNPEDLESDISRSQNVEYTAALRAADFFPVPAQTRPSSPASESIYTSSPTTGSGPFAHTTRTGPGHGYHDPTFYRAEVEQIPPVPPLPAQYQANFAASSPSSSHVPPLSPRRAKALPRLPPVRPQTAVDTVSAPRAKSTPPIQGRQPRSPTHAVPSRPSTSAEPQRSQSISLEPTTSASIRRRRQLPQPPGPRAPDNPARRTSTSLEPSPARPTHPHSHSFHSSYQQQPLDVNLNLELTPSTPLDSSHSTSGIAAARPALRAQTGTAKYGASHNGRSLPPTPVSPYASSSSTWDLPSTSGSSSSNAPLRNVNLTTEREIADKDLTLGIGMGMGTPTRDRDSAFDLPPPAYHSIYCDGKKF